MKTDIKNNQLLRLYTAGSVDHGKSTLIGRLLYDSKSIFEDQLASVETISKRKGQEEIDLAMFTDGLREEREQGITIDVAYRYFTTPKRKFIIADTPGHFEFTRNMITGASTANVSIILIDAKMGIMEQTKRHSFIASLLHIPHLIVAVNKMDSVGYSEAVFNKIVEDYEAISSKLVIKDIQFIPISALNGDNVVTPSEKMEWYQGAPLLHTLEHIYIASDDNIIDARFPIQTVLKDTSSPLYLGRITSGILRKNDEVIVLPSGETTKIKRILQAENEVEEAFSNRSIALELEAVIPAQRGEMLARINNQPKVTQEINAMICWLSNEALDFSKEYLIVHAHNEQKARLKDLIYKIDIHTLERIQPTTSFSTNDIGRMTVHTERPLMVDAYSDNRVTGSFILVDLETNETVGAGFIIR